MGDKGRAVFGVLEALDFTIDDKARKSLVAIFEKLKEHDGKKYGTDVKIGFAVGKSSALHDDALDGNQRIAIYRDIVKILGIEVPKQCEIPDKVKDFRGSNDASTLFSMVNDLNFKPLPGKTGTMPSFLDLHNGER